MVSVSGIRGTIGGQVGDNLTPEDIVRFTAAYATLLQEKGHLRRVVIGRDGRISGPLVQSLVSATIRSMGFDVIDLGLTTTPTVEMAVPAEQAAGGIILTASHNPRQWNALKLLNEDGEFLSASDGKALLDRVAQGGIHYAEVDQLGKHILAGNYLDYHVEKILALPYLPVQAIRQKKFRVVVDAINSTGALAVPRLLEALGAEVTVINQEVTGDFAHNPEPLPDHLTELCECVAAEQADLGIAVDPDVDRLAFVTETGEWFGEEYTLVAAADFLLGHRPGPVVSNLSSSRALRDLAARHGQPHSASAVGEVHVVTEMRRTKAVIGGEGNGGVILPDLHYGRDALVGIALVMGLLVERGTSLQELRATYPNYAMVKMKAPLTSPADWEAVLGVMKDQFSAHPQSEIDGLKIDLPDGWVHLRKSNTEPIVRIYTEHSEPGKANDLGEQVARLIEQTVGAA